jgi:hypothetical protein
MAAGISELELPDFSIPELFIPTKLILGSGEGRGGSRRSSVSVQAPRPSLTSNGSSLLNQTFMTPRSESPVSMRTSMATPPPASTTPPVPGSITANVAPAISSMHVLPASELVLKASLSPTIPPLPKSHSASDPTSLNLNAPIDPEKVALPASPPASYSKAVSAPCAAGCPRRPATPELEPSCGASVTDSDITDDFIEVRRPQCYPTPSKGRHINPSLVSV